MSTELEIWKPVLGYEGYYEVSSIGNLRRLSVASESVRKNHPEYYYGPRPVMGTVSRSTGYRYASLSRKCKVKIVGFHILVAKAFLGPRPTGHEVLHGDGDKLNNKLSNLRWGTPKENQADRVKHGTHQFGEANASSKLLNVQRLDVLRRRESGEFYHEIASSLGVSTYAIWRVCNRKTWMKYATT